MKNRALYYLTVGAILAFFSCNREISDDTLSAEMKAQQFRSGQITGGKVYYVKSSKGLQKFPFHEIYYSIRDIRDAHPEAADWKIVDQKQRSIIAEVTGKDTPLSQELVAELESGTYLFLDRYLLKEPIDNRKSQAAAYYMRLLFKYVKEPSQWDLLAHGYMLATPKLSKAEKNSIFQYIQQNAELVAQKQAGLNESPDLGREQLKSALFALNMLKRPRE